MSSLREFKRLNTRRASILHAGGFRPTGDPLATHFGLQPLGRSGDPWPSFAGRPLLFVCQLNLTNAPAVPALLLEFQLMTFFVDGGLSPKSKIAGQDWCLFAHASLDGLVPLVRPSDAPKLRRGAECSWESCDDHPTEDDPERQVPSGFDDSNVELENMARSKIGGYATTVQSEPWWGYEQHPAEPAFCLQFAAEEKVGLSWGDGGIISIARGTSKGFTDQWFLDWQSY